MLPHMYGIVNTSNPCYTIYDKYDDSYEQVVYTEILLICPTNFVKKDE
jgi:hypothetical protein